MSVVKLSIDLGGRALTIETGRMAKQAAGSVLVTYGDTMVLAAVTADQPVQISSVRLAIPLSRPEYPSIVFPTAQGGVVRPSAFDTPGTVTIPYELHGPQQGDGCVLATTEQVDYGRNFHADVRYPNGTNECVANNEVAQRVLSIRVPSRYEGTICHSLSFAVHSNAIDADRQTQQSLCLRVERSATIWTRMLGILMALLAVLPLFLLAVLNRVTGRLPTFPSLTTARVPLGVTAERLRQSRPDLFALADFKSGGTEGSSRLIDAAEKRIEIAAHAITVPRAKGGSRFAPLMIFTGPRKYLRGTGEPVIVGSGRTVIFAGRTSDPLRLPASLDGLWVVIPSRAAGQQSPDAPVPVELVTFRVAGVGYSVQDLSDGISDALRRPSTLQPFVGEIDPGRIEASEHDA